MKSSPKRLHNPPNGYPPCPFAWQLKGSLAGVDFCSRKEVKKPTLCKLEEGIDCPEYGDVISARAGAIAI